MSQSRKKKGVTRPSPGVMIRAVRKTTEVSLRKKTDQDGVPVMTVPSVVRRRSKAGIKSVKKTTELPVD